MGTLAPPLRQAAELIDKQKTFNPNPSTPNPVP